ncbi:DENN domain-containing protein 10-like [Thrips palmi]|uniref:DENN domain-containing protein 10-like n=1 Tax=Thrips palmi TaxID=161013 RepID=A0A6P9AC11_THRPL|nr:DENN domain-containing protein 10-like [Thrips palmi]
MAVLSSCSIIERDINGDVLWAWTFPSISDQQRSISLRKCCLTDGDGGNGTGNGTQRFIYGRLGKQWFYIGCTEVFDSDNLPWVKQFALVLWTVDFNPEKYETLIRILSKTYCKTGDPSVMLRLYLSVATSGSCTTEENGTFLVKEFDTRQKLRSSHTMVKELINMFGLEIILIYTAMLLRKRVVVYHHSLQALQKWVRSFPALMSHRSEANDLYPWVDLVPEEVAPLKVSQCHIAGFRDSAVGSRTDLYDVLVNLPAREISVSPHAKESMVMTKTHKEIAVQLVQLAAREDATESQIVKEVSDRTSDLINHLKSLSSVTDADGRAMVSVEELRKRGFAAPLENFLFNLAVAENMIIL